MNILPKQAPRSIESLEETLPSANALLSVDILPLVDASPDMAVLLPNGLSLADCLTGTRVSFDLPQTDISFPQPDLGKRVPVEESFDPYDLPKADISFPQPDLEEHAPDRTGLDDFFMPRPEFVVDKSFANSVFLPMSEPLDLSHSEFPILEKDLPMPEFSVNETPVEDSFHPFNFPKAEPKTGELPVSESRLPDAFDFPKLESERAVTDDHLVLPSFGKEDFDQEPQ